MWILVDDDKQRETNLDVVSRHGAEAAEDRLEKTDILRFVPPLLASSLNICI